MTDLKKISLMALFLAGACGSPAQAMEGQKEGEGSVPHRAPHSEGDHSTDAEQPGAPGVHGAPSQSAVELEAQVREAELRVRLEALKAEEAKQKRRVAEDDKARLAAEADRERIAREMREKAEAERERQRQAELARKKREEEEAARTRAAQSTARPNPAQVLHPAPPQGRLGSRLQQLARAPRPPAGSSKGDVVAHNISVESARAVQGVQKVAHKVGRFLDRL